jgi:uncharacterized membrane protein (UPF0127 family)
VTATARPLRFRRLPLADVASHRVPVAVTLVSRALGLALLRAERIGDGLLIPRCRSVHTFGMRAPLDLVFLDAEMEPLSVRRGVPANRVVREPRASAVVELRSEVAPPPTGGRC